MAKISWFGAREFVLQSFNDEASTCLEAAKELKRYLAAYQDMGNSERKLKAASLKDFTAKCRDIHESVIGHIVKGKSPLGIEQSLKLSGSLDRLCSSVVSCAESMNIAGIVRMDDHITKMSQLIIDMCEELMQCCGKLKDIKDIEPHTKRLGFLCRESEAVYKNAMSELFHFFKNSMDILKYREVYGSFASAAACCKEAMEALDHARIKNS